jgi:hypothetical protein
MAVSNRGGCDAAARKGAEPRANQTALLARGRHRRATRGQAGDRHAEQIRSEFLYHLQLPPSSLPVRWVVTAANLYAECPIRHRTRPVIVSRQLITVLNDYVGQ